MPVFFAFSDESGKYKKERNDKFISKNPFFCRSAIILEAQDWLNLREKFSRLKKEFLHLSARQEIKWSYLWSLFKHLQKKEKIPARKPYFPLRQKPLDTLFDFIRRGLQLLSDCPSTRILLTITFNERDRTESLEIKEMARLHLTYILKTAENEMARIPHSACVLFFNREEPALERCLKEAFSEIGHEGFAREYPHLKESLNFEYFPQAAESQVADYCAGVFNGCCRLYPQSVDLFRHQLWPRILKKNSHAVGYGISEIPENSKNRAYLRQILDHVFSLNESDYRISLESRLK